MGRCPHFGDMIGCLLLIHACHMIYKKPIGAEIRHQDGSGKIQVSAATDTAKAKYLPQVLY